MRTVLPFAIWAWFASAAAAQDFIVHTPDGSQPAAPLGKIGADWSVRLAGKFPQLVLGADVISIRRDGGKRPDWPTRDFLILTSGERIPFDAAGPFLLEEDRLIFRLDPSIQLKRAPPVRVPSAYVAALVRTVPDGEDDADLFLARLQSVRRPSDLLLLRNGDRIEGKLKDISTERGFWFDVDGRKVETPLSKASVFLAGTELEARPRLKKTHAELVLEGGGRLLLADARLDAKPGAAESGVLAGKTVTGLDLEIPLGKVLALEIHGGRAVYLSDLKPKSYEHKPYLGLSWPLARDRAVSGRPLRLGGQTYDKGLGMHAASEVTYALDSAYRWFETTVGIDAKAGRRGQARVSVLVDGKEQESCAKKEITAGDPPLDLRIDVRQAKTLTLRVDLANFGDVQAHVDWAEARLIRD